MKLIGKYTPEMVYHKDRLLIRDRSGYGPMPADGPNPLLNAGYYDFDGFTGEFGYDWAGDDIIKYFKGYRGDPWSLEVFMHYSIIATNGHLFESGSYKLYIDTSDQLRFQNFYSPPTGFQDIILGDISSYDDQWIQIKILCDGVNLTAHIGSTELYSGTITAYSDGVQYPHFTLGDRNQAGAQPISHIKLTTTLYRFLWTFD